MKGELGDKQGGKQDGSRLKDARQKRKQETQEINL
jgi:hypothetical protein